ncbi:MBL fold metallo-hydrolase [Paenibacillus massiliensis]|uniref:MBL fold metallo-hydrolase n=1 Tax=Paenibacillus massiliensis TaxID=225917 RepID=UPI00036426CB|nr:MBL fold metallo-hydrolase [Paenibacillus massiliensis]
MISVTIWGGAGEHGRSCYLITGEEHKILLDCGVKKVGTGEYPLLSNERVPELTAVFLSHAHEDHSMALPLLYKLGYRGEVWTTRATAEQLDSYFRSWSTFVHARQGELPYEEEHIQAITYRYIEETVSAGQWHRHTEGVSFRWGRTGHLAGSVWYDVVMEGRRIFFSGDYNAESELIAADRPEVQVAEEASLSIQQNKGGCPDISIVDAAYGMDVETQEDKQSQLRAELVATFQNGGHVLMPVPAFGRGQDLLVWVGEQFPDIPLIVENKVWNGLRQLLQWKDWLRPEAEARIVAAMDRKLLHIPSSDAERVQLLAAGPSVIFTADGTMESVSSQWYYQQLATESTHTVLLTGHTYKDTFGNRLLKGELVSGFNVKRITYKVHQGLEDVRVMLRSMPARQTLLVHAPWEETNLVRDELEGSGFSGIYSLKPGMTLGCTEVLSVPIVSTVSESGPAR